MNTGNASKMAWNEVWLGQVVAALAGPGFLITPNAVPQATCAALRAEAVRLNTAFQPAGIGRGSTRDASVRGDHIHWLDWDFGRDGPHAEAWAGWWAGLEELRQRLNRELFLGLREFEGHFARYPEGCGYARHLDNPRGGQGRVVTLILYLNPDWQQTDGGALELYAPEEPDRLVARAYPESGTVALFMSADFPHAVLPTRRERLALTGWWRRD